MSGNIALNYRSSGPVVSKFLECDAFVAGILGPYGSGKTTACIMKAMMASQRQHKDAQGRRRSRGAVVRNTYPDLKTTTLKSWNEWIPLHFGKWQPEGPPTHTIHGADGMECEVIFLALDNPDDVRKLLGTELTWAWLNEVREMPKAVLDGLTGRVGRFPVACNGPQILMDTNAPDSDHWYYRLAEEDRPEGYAFFRQPGGLDVGAENLMWLNQTPESLTWTLDDPRRSQLGRLYYQRMAAGKDQDWIDVYIHAKYGYVKDGKPVYPEYVDGHHCRLFELDPELPIFIGLDFGLTPAATIGQRDRMGRWRVRHEIVTEDMDAIEFGEELDRFLNQKFSDWEIEEITCDPSGDERKDTDKSTPRRIMRKFRIDAKPARTNDPILRNGVVKKWLTREIRGEPGFLIHPDCKVLRKALAGGYCMRRVQVVGQERYRDKPEKNQYSHVADALQYMLIGAGESILERDREPPERARILPGEAPLIMGEGAWMV